GKSDLDRRGGDRRSGDRRVDPRAPGSDPEPLDDASLKNRQRDLGETLGRLKAIRTRLAKAIEA
ncbi:MAG: hypothetical protein AAFY47_04270, partial [Pseudomonadota bacterium]